MSLTLNLIYNQPDEWINSLLNMNNFKISTDSLENLYNAMELVQRSGQLNYSDSELFNNPNFKDMLMSNKIELIRLIINQNKSQVNTFSQQAVDYYSNGNATPNRISLSESVNTMPSNDQSSLDSSARTISFNSSDDNTKESKTPTRIPLRRLISGELYPEDYSDSSYSYISSNNSISSGTYPSGSAS